MHEAEVSEDPLRKGLIMEGTPLGAGALNQMPDSANACNNATSARSFLRVGAANCKRPRSPQDGQRTPRATCSNSARSVFCHVGHRQIAELLAHARQLVHNAPKFTHGLKLRARQRGSGWGPVRRGETVLLARLRVSARCVMREPAPQPCGDCSRFTDHASRHARVFPFDSLRRWWCHWGRCRNRAFRRGKWRLDCDLNRRDASKGQP